MSHSQWRTGGNRLYGGSRDHEGSFQCNIHLCTFINHGVDGSWRQIDNGNQSAGLGDGEPGTGQVPNPYPVQ